MSRKEYLEKQEDRENKEHAARWAREQERLREEKEKQWKRERAGQVQR